MLFNIGVLRESIEYANLSLENPEAGWREKAPKALMVGGLSGASLGVWTFATVRGPSGKQFDSLEISAALRKYDAEQAASVPQKFSDAFQNFLKGKSSMIGAGALLEAIAAKAPPDVAIKFLQKMIYRLTSRELGSLVAAMTREGSAIPPEVTKQLMPQIIAKARGSGQEAVRTELRTALSHNQGLMEPFSKTIAGLRPVVAVHIDSVAGHAALKAKGVL